MKGIVFTEFIDMVEQHYRYEMMDELLTETPSHLAAPTRELAPTHTMK